MLGLKNNFALKKQWWLENNGGLKNQYAALSLKNNVGMINLYWAEKNNVVLKNNIRFKKAILG